MFLPLLLICHQICGGSKQFFIVCCDMVLVYLITVVKILHHLLLVLVRLVWIGQIFDHFDLSVAILLVSCVDFSCVHSNFLLSHLLIWLLMLAGNCWETVFIANRIVRSPTDFLVKSACTFHKGSLETFTPLLVTVSSSVCLRSKSSFLLLENLDKFFVRRWLETIGCVSDRIFGELISEAILTSICRIDAQWASSVSLARWNLQKLTTQLSEFQIVYLLIDLVCLRGKI